ncbi:MAG: radical SAM family heme chaperone HemW [Clostridia bacterium]|nr:radical SAM family heme chaperone HemW [Clostridia bacterium]
MNPRNKTGLYIHIPFCRSKCPYCDFYSLPPGAARGKTDAYLDALCDELKTGARTAAFTGGERPAISSIYIGGGTPSAVDPEKLAQVLETAFLYYPVEAGAEVTVEANPASAGGAFFRAMKAAGANRISLGLQSAVDPERRALGRTADFDGVKRAVNAARDAGFENLSLDLMLGVPGQTAESLEMSLERCAELSPEHISAYILQLEEGTPFYNKRASLALPGEDAVCEMYRTLVARLGEYGFLQYEISNFARPGFESRHNMNYWRCGEYIGVGAAAHSFYRGRRFFYPRDLDAFIAGGAPVDDGEGGTPDEFMMLALRTADGLLYKDYEAYFGTPVDPKYIEGAKRIPEKYLRIFDGGFALTAEGFLISNTVIAEII